MPLLGGTPDAQLRVIGQDLPLDHLLLLRWIGSARIILSRSSRGGVSSLRRYLGPQRHMTPANVHRGDGAARGAHASSGTCRMAWSQLSIPSWPLWATRLSSPCLKGGPQPVFSARRSVPG